MNAARGTGFTLLELIVTLVILAILTAMAVTTWQRHLERGWRAEARAAMSAAMLNLERHALSAMTFADGAGGQAIAGNWPQPVPAPPARVRHLVVAYACPDAGIETCVELHAVPQMPDSDCGTLILRSTGEWMALPPATGQPLPLPATC